MWGIHTLIPKKLTKSCQTINGSMALIIDDTNVILNSILKVMTKKTNFEINTEIFPSYSREF